MTGHDEALRLPPPPQMRPIQNERDVVLDTAKELLSGDRQDTYGDPTASHARIGRIWGAILDREDIPADVVALMMAGLKTIRAARQPGHQDSYVDMAGYAALAGEAAKKKEN